MLNSVIYKQKEEKERFLTLPYIERAKAPEAKKWLESSLIKVILGPRRAGKSVFSLMILKDRPFAYFNFDDDIVDQLNLDELLAGLKMVYGDTKYLLLDEIQNLPRWELFVNRLHREGYNVILTGSNAQLLSQELATVLTGRHIPIEILPFDFKEFLQAKKYRLNNNKLTLPEEKGVLLQLLQKYLQTGSYPEVAVNNLDPKGYFDVLFDSLLFKDVVKRHHIRFSEQIDSLGAYLINNVATQYSVRKLVNVLGFKSGVTVEKYLGYLKEAYIIFSLARYSTKAHERVRSPKKIYAVDSGFVYAQAVQHSPDTGRLMENLVFTELVKRGAQPNRDLFYYHTRNQKEVDFVLRKGTSISELIQVCYDISDPEVSAREVKALLEAQEELHAEKLTILTWDEKKQVNKDGVVIDFVPLWEWLLV